MDSMRVWKRASLLCGGWQGGRASGLAGWTLSVRGLQRRKDSDSAGKSAPFDSLVPRTRGRGFAAIRSARRGGERRKMRANANPVSRASAPRVGARGAQIAARVSQKAHGNASGWQRKTLGTGARPCSNAARTCRVKTWGSSGKGALGQCGVLREFVRARAGSARACASRGVLRAAAACTVTSSIKKYLACSCLRMGKQSACFARSKKCAGFPQVVLR